MVSISISLSISRQSSTRSTTSTSSFRISRDQRNSTIPKDLSQGQIQPPSYSHSLAHSVSPSPSTYSCTAPRSSNNSHERLLSSSHSSRSKRYAEASGDRTKPKRVRTMAREHVVSKGEVGPFNIQEPPEERKMSYGIGGAGNIRRPSDVIYPPRTNPDGTRRRSSVWSSINVSPSTSPDGKRYSLMSLFGGRKGSIGQDENGDVGMEEGVGDEDGVRFNDVDLGGRVKGKGKVGDDE